jgi:ssDNA-binding Zn-finger/Zn-ribbon topoisomerase 1
MDIAKYIIKANKIHNNKYDYSYLHQFKNQHELIKIICPIHGEFLKEAANHVHKILKQGCPICGYEMGNAKLRMTHDEFHDRALYTHGNFYNYSEVKELDEGIKTKISIICPLPGHGENGRFIQRVSDHLSGNGCPECGKIKGADANRVSTGDFIRRSREIHGNKFDYSKTFWKGSYINVEIICPDCGPFLIRPHNHWIRDCPKCSQKMRIKQNLWLDSLDLPNDAEHREVKITLHAEWFRVDGYNKKTNTIYEFNGDFWHGNPKKYSSNIINPVSGVTYGDLYKNTCLREIKLKNNGYQVISIWESDWDKTS